MTFEQEQELGQAAEAGVSQRTFRERMEDVVVKSEKLAIAASAMLEAANQTKLAAKNAMREIQ